MKTWNDLSFWESPGYRRLISRLVVGPDEYVPNAGQITRALDVCPFRYTDVVILGQDPYHTPGVADGLAFSTWPHNRTIPPSLRNIFKEYQNDLGLPKPKTGDLSCWAGQGVLLLNTCLTTKPGKAGAHRGWGWEKLTIEIIGALSERGRCVFILWGRDAQEYSGLIDTEDGKNWIIKSSHPSPLSARHSFFGSKPFSRCNHCLESWNKTPINWKLR